MADQPGSIPGFSKPEPIEHGQPGDHSRRGNDGDKHEWIHGNIKPEAPGFFLRKIFSHHLIFFISQLAGLFF